MKKVSTIHVVSFLVGMLLLFSSPAHSEEFKAWVFSKLPSAPEGIAVDSKGTLYVSLFNECQIGRLDNDGKYHPIAYVPSEKYKNKGHLMGLVTDKDDNIYACFVEKSKYTELEGYSHPARFDVNITKTGIYKINPKTGGVSAVATRGDGYPFCFPDDIDMDTAGNIYFTDFTFPAIFKISNDGKVDIWAEPTEFRWTKSSDLPWGPNVLVIDNQEKNIYCSNSADASIMRIPIKEDGSAGEAVYFSKGHTDIDGLEIDDEGYLYVSEQGSDEITILHPEPGTYLPFYPFRHRIADRTNAPFDWTCSLVLRDGVLYATQLGWASKSPANTVVAIKGFKKPTQ